MVTARDWREYPRRYRYEAAKCVKCGYIAFPERLVCPECKAREFEKVILPREGKLLTYTVIHTPPSWFKDLAPYAVGVVELTNGARLTAQIADCDLDKIDTVEDVKLEFRKVQEDGNAGVIRYGYKVVPVY